MIGTILKDKAGTPINAQVSAYVPSQEIKDLTVKIQEDYQLGFEIQHRVYKEFNDRTLFTVLDDNQKLWLNYVEPKSEDPDEYWRANTVRPLTRNKLLSIASHITARVIYPNVFAQNEQDEEDEEAADVMKALMLWNVENSDYEMTFLYADIQALVSPAVILKNEFAEVMQEIKIRAENGKITKKEVLDEILSGLQTHVVPVEELLISNIYEFDIQRQRFLIRRRFINYDEAKALYGDNVNFKYIRPGIKVVFNGEDGQFYDLKDEENPDLVEELTYYNRREDLELVYVNGIVMSAIDQPIKHRDSQNRPKYPFVKSGYHPIDEKRFFYYFSAAEELSNDAKLVNTMWRMTLDGTALVLDPPYGVYGDEHINSGIAIPGSAHPFKKDTKIEPLFNGTNLTAGYNALQMLEKSMAESSQDTLQQGVQGASNRTAFELARLEQNAKVQLGLFGKMIAKMVKDLGYLMIENIIHHQTIGEVEEILGGGTRLKFRTFMIPSTKEKVKFTDEFFGEEFEEEDKELESFRLMEEEGGFESKQRLYMVNPRKFRRLKFLLSVEADFLLPKIEEFEKAMKLELFDRAIQLPFINQEEVTKDFLFGAFKETKGQEDKYIKKMEQPAGQGLEALMGGAQSSNLVKQTTKSNALQSLLTQPQ